MALFETLIVLGTVFCILYKLGTRTYDFWEKKGVSYIKPRLPFAGGCLDIIFKKGPQHEPVIDKIYNSFPGQRLVGWFRFQEPILIVRDLELAKKVLISDFEHFSSRNEIFDFRYDPVGRKSIVALNGQPWKDMRDIVTPGFTISKIKDMLLKINKCGKQMTEYLTEAVRCQVEENHPDKNVITLEIQDFFRKFLIDTMAAVTFGMDIDSFKDPGNELNEMIERHISKSRWSKIRMLLFWLFPSLMKLSRVRFFKSDPSLLNFFKNQLHQNIKEREEQNISRCDLLNTFCSARNGKITDENNPNLKRDITDDDIISQLYLIFIGGIRSPVVALGFIAQELAENPEIQKRLQGEIDQVIEEDEGVTYEGIMHKMKYLDMVINESLRKWTPATTTGREVTKRYVIPKTDNSSEVVLEKGEVVWVPISSFLRDPEYFSELNWKIQMGFSNLGI